MPSEFEKYTYRVEWSDEDAEFVATCAEFPSLSWLAGAQLEALEGIRKLVRHTLRDLKANGDPIPEPISSRQFSGKFVVRLPPTLHRKLATAAAEEGVSLNRYVSNRLAGE